MKRIIAAILLLCMGLTLAACGKVEITMQEIYDANQTEVLLENHQSVYIRDEMGDDFWCEKYLTRDYFFDYFPDEEFAWMEFITDDVRYYYVSGDSLLYLFITPDGVGNFASERAERSAMVALMEDAADYTIESLSKKDGRIAVTSVLSQKALDVLAEDGVTSGKIEFVLDAKTHEILSLNSGYTFEDGTDYNTGTKVTYDAEAPEALKTFLAYVNQTENLRNVTVVSNPGTDKEETKSIQAPKGLIIGFEYDDETGYTAEFYTDAACTENYDPYADTDSDLTIYVKWIRA